ncbi:MAG: hypothetical protein WA160_12250 [Pseudobdellovibrio sp.]
MKSRAKKTIAKTKITKKKIAKAPKKNLNKNTKNKKSLSSPVDSTTGTTLPVGTIVSFIGTNASIPANWFNCDGSGIPANYSKLRALCTNSNTPNLAGRTLIGQGTSTTDTNNVVKSWTTNSFGGEYSHSMAVTEMPRHSHTFQWAHDSGSTQSNSINWETKTIQGALDYSSYVGGDPASGDTPTNGIAFNVMQPYYVICYIIYAGPADY